MKSLFYISVIVMLLGCHTTGPHTGEILDVEQASVLAQRLANQKAQVLYHQQPFINGSPAQFVAGRWEWQNLRPYGHADLEARVSFAPNGSMPTVEILLLDSRTRQF